LAEIHRNIEDGAPDNAHKLGLSSRRDLQVKAANGSRPGRERLILLYESCGDPPEAKFLRAIGFREISSLVFEPARGDQQNAVKR